MSQAKRRSGRTQRTRPSYTEPESGDDEQQAVHPVEAQRPSPRVRLPKRRSSWLVDDSADETSSDSGNARRRKPRRSNGRRDHVDVIAAVSTRINNRRDKPRTGKILEVAIGSIPTDRGDSSRSSSRLLPSDNIIPPWIDLPSEILVIIFQYCYEPDKTAWMLDLASRVCKTFAEPALTALYNCPITHDTPLEKLDRLVHHLQRSKDSNTLFKYGTKVHHLHLPRVPRAPRRNETPDSFLQLARLLLLAPTIRSLSLDTSGGASNHAASQLLLTELLFSQLAQQTFLIRHCHWEAQVFVQEVVRSRNVCPLFDSLERLELDAVYGQMHDTPLDRHLLPSLKHLKITFQAVPEPAFDWQLIPRSLLSLDLTGIDQDSTGLLAYLLRPAEVELLDLRLSSALYGDMAFLSSLGQTCPQLEKFHLDLAPFRPEPMRPPVDRFMELSDVMTPSWPTSLQEISLKHFRWADAQGAESLFQSFIDDADRLVNLRSIDIKVHLYNPSWRHRKVLRSKWGRRFRRVFQQRTIDPAPNLRSLKAFRLCNAEESSDHNVLNPTKAEPATASRTTARRSSRIAQQESDDESEESEGDSTEDDAQLPRQGLCSKVSINIDNQRPRGVEMTEGDFLDSEPSGDEDWTGG